MNQLLYHQLLNQMWGFGHSSHTWISPQLPEHIWQLIGLQWKEAVEFKGWWCTPGRPERDVESCPDISNVFHFVFPWSLLLLRSRSDIPLLLFDQQRSALYNYRPWKKKKKKSTWWQVHGEQPPSSLSRGIQSQPQCAASLIHQRAEDISSSFTPIQHQTVC